jgi:esterase/lipase superfamily enzyme
MRREFELWSDELGVAGRIIVHGTYGRPLIAFPSQQGDVADWERGGMVDAVQWLINEGRVKVYSVASNDTESWFSGVSLEDAARRHDAYERWLVERVVPFIWEDCDGFQEILLTGCSFGAYHAANFALRHAELFPAAICMSGVYDLSGVAGGERGMAAYFHDPMAYVGNLHGDHLEWLRRQLTLVLVCGQGMWEDTTGSLEGTRRFGAKLAEKGLRHELDVWGHDVAHDWPWWQRQLAHHLPRFV